MGGSINDEEVQTYFCDRNGSLAQAMQKTVLPMGMMGQIPWAILQKNMITGRSQI